MNTTSYDMLIKYARAYIKAGRWLRAYSPSEAEPFIQSLALDLADEGHGHSEIVEATRLLSEACGWDVDKNLVTPAAAQRPSRPWMNWNFDCVQID